MDLRAPPSPQTPQHKNPFLGLGILLLLLVLAMQAYGLWRPDQGAQSPNTQSHLRSVAARLRAAGLNDEAAKVYEDFLRADTTANEERAATAYGLGQLNLDNGRYEKALRWFYEAQVLGAKNSELAKKIVHCLDALGRVNEAQAALRASVSLPGDKGDDVTRSAQDALVAQIGEDRIYQSDIRRAIDDLPAPMRKGYDKPEAFESFAQKYVADELIWRKAQKREYADDPDVRRQLAQMLKGLVVQRFVEKEVIGDKSPDSATLQAFFNTNPERYAQSPAYRLSLIQVADENKAKEAQKALAQGMPFADAAKKYSMHTSKKSGGALTEWTSVVPGIVPGIDPRLDPMRVETLLKDLKPGQSSSTLGGGQHFYIFSHQGRQPGKQRAYAEVQEQVARDYQQQRAQAAYIELIQKELARPDVHLLLGQGSAK